MTGVADPTILRLLCLPGAGASAARFERLRPALIGVAELRTFELPGRGIRFAEPPLSSLVDHVTHYVERVEAEPFQRWVLLGESLGALTAKFVVRALADSPRADVVGLITVAASPTVTGRRSGEEVIKRLRADAARSHRAVPMAPDAVLTDIAAAQAIGRPLRPQPIEVPVATIQARNDGLIPIEDAKAWQASATSGWWYREVPGNHYQFEYPTLELLDGIRAGIEFVSTHTAADRRRARLSRTVSREEEGSYDVVVIGSGMGGLAAASILAQVGGKRVLVLESHFKLGGFLHSFRRHGYEWDPGVHYIGDMSEGALTRQCMDLVTGGDIRWHKLDHLFERFVLPGETVAVPSDPTEYRRALVDRFPTEARSINRYFSDLRRVRRWSQRWFYSKQFRGPMASVVAAGRGRAMEVTQDYLDRRFKDPVLKAVLAGQWPDYGTRPAESAFGCHATVAADFLGGGYYPVGGSSALVQGAVAKITEHGGMCLARHRVERILIERGQVCGVEVSTSSGLKRFLSSRVISNAGVATTFDQLIDREHGLPERERLKGAKQGPSAVVLFLGLNDDPRRRGFEDCNYWVYEGLDHNRLDDPNVFPPPTLGAFLSFGSLRNPAHGRQTAQIISFSDLSAWSAYRDRPWKKRGEAYEALKKTFGDQLIDFIDRRLPGLREMVAYQELATPLTVESFTGHPYGQIYGRACTPERLSTDQWSIGTSVRGLYLTGTDIVVPGVNSALMIGVMTAGKLLGSGGTARVIHRARSRPPGHAPIEDSRVMDVESSGAVDV